MNDRRTFRHPKLAGRFRDLVARCASEADGERLYRTIEDKYSEPHRHYHTLSHIRHCLEQLDRAAHLAADAEAIELALWFHDVIYDPTLDDNELRSALFFDANLGIHLPDERAGRVHHLIMATEYPSEPRDGDARLMVDIDLSSFGLPWEEFMRDTRAIEAEYSHVPEEQYTAGKRKFLNSLLSRPRLYLTDYLHDRLEAQARSNIEQYLREDRKRA